MATHALERRAIGSQAFMLFSAKRFVAAPPDKTTALADLRVFLTNGASN